MRKNIGFHHSRFSTSQLIIFAFIFAAIGGIIIYKSFAATSGPITITAGGTYTGDWASSGTTSPVKIATSQPVIIENSTISTTGSGNLVDANYPAVNLIIRNSKFNAPTTGAGQAIFAYGYKSVTMEHNDINGSWGIRLDNAQSGGAVAVRYNKVRNISSGVYAPHFFQTANNQYTIPIEVSWNEIIDTFTQTNVEDVISIHTSSGAKIHDNYIQGAYPPTLTGGFSGSGIMMDSGAHDNEVYNNQVIETVNAGIGISSGWNNSVHDNRVIFDGRDDSGNLFSAANVGIYVSNSNNETTWANNHAINNTIGWIRYDGIRNTMDFPITPEDYAKNTELPTASITHALEQAEYQLWLNKLSTNGITVGQISTSAPAPIVSISASPTNIASGASSTLIWNSTNATSCIASGAWSGNQAISGTLSVSPTTTSSYSISCTGAGGSAQASTTIIVNTSGPDGWTYCATEATHCTFSGTMSVRYGANGIYFIKTFTNGADCDNATFGDPVPGATKHCDYQPLVSTPGDLSGDGHVTITDLSILLTNYGSNNTTADIDKSGKVDITDLSILLSHYGT